MIFSNKFLFYFGFLMYLNCFECRLHNASNPNVWPQIVNIVDSFDNEFYSASLQQLSTKAKFFSNKESVSFVVSPLCLLTFLTAISTGATGKTLKELEAAIHFNGTTEEKKDILQSVNDNFPQAGNDLRLEMTNMVFLNQDLDLQHPFHDLLATYLNTTMYHVHFTNSSNVVDVLNKKVKDRIQRRMIQVYDEGDLSDRDSTVILSSIYFKDRWGYVPTVLNDTYEFKLREEGPHEKLSMYRMTGVMPFAELPELDAVVVDIPYATPGLSMLLFLPNTIEGLADMYLKILEHENIISFTAGIVKDTPIALTLPKYTIDSVVLLPSKLRMLGVRRILRHGAGLSKMYLKKRGHISHFVQRVKLWADEGKGAYKDTGDEEFPHPERTIYADHPFFFIVKLNGASFIMGQLYL